MENELTEAERRQRTAFEASARLLAFAAGMRSNNGALISAIRESYDPAVMLDYDAAWKRLADDIELVVLAGVVA